MTSEDTWTAALADFIVTTEATDVPAGATDAAMRAVADTLGVMLAGRGSEAGRVLARYLDMWAGQDGAAWVVGSTQPAPAEIAAMVNAGFGHALDYDDTFPGAGHPSSLILATILASASTRPEPLSGQDLVTAFTIGFEVMAGVARAMGVGHYYRGWHVTGTVGTIAAAATASRVLAFDRTRTRTALGIAASLASGMQRNFGTTTKPMHSGLAARNGIIAAELVSAGATASTSILDGPRGFFDLYGQGQSAPETLRALGSPFALVDPGTGLKKYPCCYIAVRPIDAVLRLRREHALHPDDVARIVCRVPTQALHAMIYPRPRTGLEAKFSIEYILAAALVDGRVGLGTFTDEAVRRDEVRAVMPRVGTEEDPDLRPEDPAAEHSGPANGGRIEVVITCADGRELRATEMEPHGGPGNPFTWKDIETKFVDCAEFGGVSAAQAKELLGQLAVLPDLPDVVGALRSTLPGR